MNRKIIAVVAVLAAFALAGCGHHQESGRGDANVFHLAMSASPTTFDPSMVQDVDTLQVLQQIFEGLVQWTPDNTIGPALADKWTVSKDGRTYTFHLRSGAVFQDGNPVTAQDVYYSLRRSLDPALKSPVAMTYLADIVGADAVNNGTAKDLAGVKVIDPQTVAITIKKPKSYWLCTMTYPTAYIVSKAEASRETGPMTDADVALGAGTGPFKLAGYTLDQKVDLTANPHYWDGPPSTQGQEWVIEKDAETRHALYVSGKLDLVDEQFGDLDVDQNDPVLGKQVHLFNRAMTLYIGLNQQAFPPFKDARVREALACAIDKQKIVKVVTQGRMDVAQDILPEGMPAWRPDFKGLPYDPARAVALLASAGYPNGAGLPVIPIYYRESRPDAEAVVTLIAQMWGDTLHIKTQLVRSQWSVLLSKEDANALPAYYLGWSADYLDPQDFYSLLFRTGSTENHTGYSNAAFDADVDAADVALDEPKRTVLYQKAARIVADEVPMIPLYYRKDPELVKPYVSGLDDCLMMHLPFKHVVLAPH